MKRTDVAGVDYDDIEAQPDETVSRFRRRWLSKKHLGIDASFVSLHCVKDGAGKPSEAEDQAALSKERLLSDPSVTLRVAGVTNGCWLLARFAVPPTGSPGARARPKRSFHTSGRTLTGV